ncbi:MAG: cysteine desulfurase family protein [Gemella sp.]|nr:cysteine desulfurase family protein [Gemella sp.]
MENIYLDYAATSLKHFDIYAKVTKQMEEIYANPSSNHQMGNKANKFFKEARKTIADFINAQEKEIIFTSGATEANNMVFNHVKENYESGEIIISEIEHPSVSECASRLESLGYKVIRIPSQNNGLIDIKKLKEAISDNTILISVMLVNNETGIINPIKEITNIAKERNILVHSDIVQAFAKTEIDVKDLGVDFASVSAHKIGATNNFGFLYARDGQVTPLLIGGGQENGLRSGTSDIFGAMVLAESIEKTWSHTQQIAELKNYLLAKLNESKIEFEVNASPELSIANIINVYFKNIQAQRLITYLDVNNIYISGTSACSSGSLKASKVITHIFDEARAENSVRISIGFNTNKEKLDILVDKIAKLEERILERG